MELSADKPPNYTSVRDQQANGRVDILSNGRPILPQLDDTQAPMTSYTDALTGNWEDSTLSVAFFSIGNIQILHNALRAGVYRRSNGRYILPQQCTDTLKVIMRGTFLSEAEHRPDQITEQIVALNDSITRFCVNQLYGEAGGYLKYRQDASTLRVPMELPIHISNTKTLEMRKFM